MPLPVLARDSDSRPLSGRVYPTSPFIEFGEPEEEGDAVRRFERMVRRYSNRVAISSDEGELTYEDLNRSVNRLAHAILAQQTGGGTVGLLLGQNQSVIRAFLAAYKAGTPYVVMDRSYPLSRLEYILRDSRAQLILTNDENAALANKLRSGQMRVLNIDELHATDLSDADPGLAFALDDLIQLTYTSGSSGHPKGLMITHLVRLHSTANYVNTWHVAPGDRLALLHPCGSGASTVETYTSLLSGATLCIYDVRERGLGDLAEWLSRQEITILHWLPTAFRRFTDTLPEGTTLPGLRMVVMGSEPLPRSDIDPMRAVLAPDCLIANRYGTTEAGTTATFFMARDTPIPTEVVPVGYITHGREVMLLDGAGETVPAGEVGEIVVKGRYCAAGYWGKPELTAATFLPDPDGGPKRIYHTGDLGRFLADGCLVHLGRKDSQTKIRGFRVELAEVEVALMAHPNVNEGVVVAQKDARGESCLVAYVVPRTPPGPSVSELHRFLAQRVPHYMMPSFFVHLGELPLTPGQKVDRSALPALDWSRPNLDAAYVAPRDEWEDSLVAIWAEVLGLAPDAIGVHDPFVELGGHSLHAAQILARVRETFQANLSPQAFFQAATVAQQARAIVHAGSQVGQNKPKLSPRRQPRPAPSEGE